MEEGGGRVLSLDTTQKRERHEKNSPLYDALNAWLGQSVPWVHRAHLTTCLWMVMALLQRREVRLTRWLPYVPCRGVQVQSKQRCLSRWLHNRRLNIHPSPQPLKLSGARPHLGLLENHLP